MKASQMAVVNNPPANAGAARGVGSISQHEGNGNLHNYSFFEIPRTVV